MMNKINNNMLFRILIILVAVFILFALVNYYNSKQSNIKSNTEKFYQSQQPVMQNQVLNQTSPAVSQPAMTNPQDSMLLTKEMTDLIKPAEETENSSFRGVDFTTTETPSDCFPRDRLTAEDLLPADAANSLWAQVNPAGQGDVTNQNFLTAGWQTGISTVSGSLRNANRQLRSEPVNPRGSWPIMNSTIVPDTLRKPFEINSDCL